VWLGDGYLTNADFAGWAGGMETMTELAWLAGRLPEVRVGITAAVLPLRDVAWLAKQANTLHRIAGGGFVLVAAAGFWAHDLAARGIDFDRRGPVFRERLDQLREALGEESLAPGPGEQGPPPLWLGGATATRRLAVELGLTYQSSRATPAELAPIAARFFDAGGTQLAHRVRIQAGGHVVRSAEVEWHAICGSVDELVDALGRFASMGVSDLSIVPGSDEATSRQTIDVLGADVLPQLAV
jgi:alkanesulfonate monooxygenase SsuD/methylene tetrahydromethanopterin reductase-like flavin-dependent oxidoreductase (luciferase family)